MRGDPPRRILSQPNPPSAGIGAFSVAFMKSVRSPHRRSQPHGTHNQDKQKKPNRPVRLSFMPQYLDCWIAQQTAARKRNLYESHAAPGAMRSVCGVGRLPCPLTVFYYALFYRRHHHSPLGQYALRHPSCPGGMICKILPAVQPARQPPVP